MNFWSTESPVHLKYLAKIVNIYYESDANIGSIVDSIDKMLDDYERASADSDLKNPLEFWKKYEHMFPSLAKLAKKYLSVQASSAALKRIFSLS